MTRYKERFSAEYLRTLVTYDPGTGLFVWNATRNYNATAGSVAGTHHPSGCIYICIGRTQYKAHRLAWLYMTGEWPPSDIDHANRNPSDNRWANLRCATRAQNSANVSRRADNKTGVKGVKAHKGRWLVRLGKGGRFYVGIYDTIEEAAKAYTDAATRIYGEFATSEATARTQARL